MRDGAERYVRFKYSRYVVLCIGAREVSKSLFVISLTCVDSAGYGTSTGYGTNG